MLFGGWEVIQISQIPFEFLFDCIGGHSLLLQFSFEIGQTGVFLINLQYINNLGDNI